MYDIIKQPAGKKPRNVLIKKRRQINGSKNLFLSFPTQII